MRELGVAMAVALLLDAFIVRPVLLPAAVEVLGRGSWWPTSRHVPVGPAGAAPPSEAPATAGAGAPLAGSPS